MKLLSLFLAFLLVFTPLVLAQEDDAAEAQQEQAVEEVATGAFDIETGVVFPDYPDKKFPAGEVIEVLVGITNTGKRTFNITSIWASLNHPQDQNVFVQNFTRWGYYWTVPPHHQVSLSYKFLADPHLDARDYVLNGHFDYFDNEFGSNYTTSFHNTTVFLFQKDTALDLSAILLYVFLLGGLGGAGYYVVARVGKKSKKSKATDASATKAEDRSDFLQGTNLSPATKQKKSPKLGKKND